MAPQASTRPTARWGVPEVFARKLRELMKDRQVTAYRLARQVGLSDQAMINLVHGVSEPSWPTVRKLARALGVSVEAFDVGQLDMPTPEEAAPRPRGRKPGGRRKRKGERS